MELPRLRSNDSVQQTTEPLTPLVIGTCDRVKDAKLADGRTGEINEPEWAAEHQPGDHCLRRHRLDEECAGARDVVGAKTSLPYGSDHI